MNGTIRFALFVMNLAILLPPGVSSAQDSGPDRRLVRLLKKGQVGITHFNRWRLRNPIAEVNLRGADLSGANLRGADLRLADLSNAKLQGAVFGLSLADEWAKYQKCKRGFKARMPRGDSLRTVGKTIQLRVESTRVCGDGFSISSRVMRSGANLAGADLKGAELDGADFTGAAGCKKVLNA